MKKPHKHAELIKAWADGAEIEYRDNTRDISLNPWRDLPPYGDWDARPVFEYRIKPEPKPDVVTLDSVQIEDNEAYFTLDEPNLKLTWCGETGKLKSAEVL